DPLHPLHLSADAPFRARPVRKAASHGFGTPGIVELLLLLLAGVVLAIAGAKMAVRRGRYLTRNPRRLAAACPRELRAILLGQGIEAPATPTPAEPAAPGERHPAVRVPALA